MSLGLGIFGVFGSLGLGVFGCRVLGLGFRVWGFAGLGSLG